VFTVVTTVGVDHCCAHGARCRYYVLNKQLEDVEKRLHGLEQARRSRS
jgi:hypothetical protein